MAPVKNQQYFGRYLSYDPKPDMRSLHASANTLPNNLTDAFSYVRFTGDIFGVTSSQAKAENFGHESV